MIGYMFYEETIDALRRKLWGMWKDLASEPIAMFPESQGTALDSPPTEGAFCENCKTPVLGSIFDMRPNMDKSLSVYWFSRQVTVRMEILDYTESRTNTTTIVDAVRPGGLYGDVLNYSGYWYGGDDFASMARINPSYSTMNGFYWHHNSCDLQGQFHGAGEIFYGQGEGWIPCFWAGCIVPAQSSQEVDPNILTGWQEDVYYQYSVMRLDRMPVDISPPRIYPPGLMFPPASGEGGQGGKRGGMKGKRGVNVIQSVTTNIKRRDKQGYI